MRNIWLLLALFTAPCKGQGLIDRMVKKIELQKYCSADIGLTDTTQNASKNYLEISMGAGDHKTSLLQAMAFANIDSTFTLVVTGLFSDEQCSFHKTFCFVTVPGSDSLHRMEALSSLTHQDLLGQSKAPAVLKTYLPRVKANYLDKTSTLDDLLNEIYSTRYEIDPATGKLLLSLDICDYIHVNQVAFKEKDWAVISKDFSKMELRYDRDKKRFVKAGNQ